ncbi:MAG: pyridoxamine 5'-phosphate oxidase family protein [Gammaproteobacteria bacterium]|nr:pyridoxamine 5'-phosphate oxidase family protein [Gammaproteobacteria bacterium]
MDTPEARTLDELIAEFDTAMLVTRAPDGALRSRPMAIAGKHSGAVLHFATRFDAPKVAELEDEPDVNVTMQAADKYLSLSGRARIIEDRNLLDELWSPAWKLWFPEGKDDPDLALIELEPETGEYWDRSGRRGARFLLEAGKAILQGSTPEYEDPEAHAKVELDR